MGAEESDRRFSHVDRITLKSSARSSCGRSPAGDRTEISKSRLMLAEAAEFLDRRDRSLLSPDEQRGLTQAPQRLTDIDVEMAREERGRGVTRAALVRRRVVDLDELAGDERIVGVRVLRDSCRSFGVDTSALNMAVPAIGVSTASRLASPPIPDRLVEPHQTRRRNQRDRGEAMRIARGRARSRMPPRATTRPERVGSSITLLTKSEMSEM